MVAAFGERHDLAIGGIGLHVVDRRDGAGGGAEGGVGRDVVHPFAADIDGSPVLQPLEASRDYVFAAAGIPQDLFRSN